MSYVVLARKWRPMSFSDLVGQDHVAQTLGNAIASGRVAHAFLFTGVRGVGKTTSARILAKALNCMGSEEARQKGEDPGPTVEPCLTCPACTEIALGSDVDVREIDGASYNGVDEVRRLQESLPYRPSRDRYKIVIVDEVHMLTQQAWNAFLKTLEEPPPHVKFIFATTEVHKVPVTILSRVQRFDFKMIPARTIGARLRHVLGAEGITADEDAISILSHKAAGSMRDGMSLLDQVIAYGGNELHGTDVARVLGVASRGAVLELARQLLTGGAAACLELVHEAAEQGFDVSVLARDLLGLLRDLVVAKIAPHGQRLIDASDDEQRAIVELSNATTEADLLRLHQGFSRGFDDIARGVDPRASLEMLLVRLAERPPLLSVDELLHRIAGLERRLAGGRGPAAPAPRPAAPRAAAPSPAASPRERAAAPPRPPEASPTSTREREGRSAPTPRESAPKPAASEARGEDDPDGEAKLLAFLETLRSTEPRLVACLEQTTFVSLSSGRLELALDRGNLFERDLTSPAFARTLTEHLTREFGKGAAFVLFTDDPRAAPERSLARGRAEQKRAEHEALIDEVKDHPLVRAAVTTLGARIKGVRVGESS